MSRLPSPGSDNGSWGTILNDFLSVSLKSTGEIADGAVTKTAVGLGNVDNTSDTNKPISTAVQTALNLKLTSTTLDSAAAALVSGSSSTATAINSKISAATGGGTPVYILAPADPDPTTGSPAGLYFRRTS